MVNKTKRNAHKASKNKKRARQAKQEPEEEEEGTKNSNNHKQIYINKTYIKSETCLCMLTKKAIAKQTRKKQTHKTSQTQEQNI